MQPEFLGIMLQRKAFWISEKFYETIMGSLDIHVSPKAIRECACVHQQWDIEHAAMAADCTGFKDKEEHVDI